MFRTHLLSGHVSRIELDQHLVGFWICAEILGMFLPPCSYGLTVEIGLFQSKLGRQETIICHKEHHMVVLRRFDLGHWSLLVRFKTRVLQEHLGTLFLKSILLLLFSLKQDSVIRFHQYFGSCHLNVDSRSSCVHRCSMEKFSGNSSQHRTGWSPFCIAPLMKQPLEVIYLKKLFSIL